MTELARSAGVARATLYNHVRSRDDALRLYAEAEALLMVTRLLTENLNTTSNFSLDRAVSAVVGAAIAVQEHKGVAVVRRDEPVLLMALLNPGVGLVWEEIRSLVRVLVSGGEVMRPAGVELVLGWILLQGVAVPRAVANEVARQELTEQAQLLLSGVLGSAAVPGVLRSSAEKVDVLNPVLS